MTCAADSPAPTALGREDCVGLLRSQAVGRILVTYRALPTAVLASYAVVADAVVVRVPAGGPLDDDGTAGGVLALEVDAPDPAGDGGWSVIVTGMAGELTDPAEIARIERMIPPTWADPAGVADRCSYLRIPFSLVSGHRHGITAAASREMGTGPH